MAKLSEKIKGIEFLKKFNTYYKPQSSFGKFAFAIINVLRMCVLAFSSKQLLLRAASLSYSSIIALGPMLAILIMISGFLLKNQTPEQISKRIVEAISYVAPQMESLFQKNHEEYLQNKEQSQLNEVSIINEDNSKEIAKEEVSKEDIEKVASQNNIDPAVLKFFINIIKTAQNGAVGAGGAFSLILISILLLSSIEKALNDIWGIKKGRSFFHRFVFYWATISLGGILGAMSLTMISVSSLKVETSIAFFDSYISEYTPLVLIGILLSFFYKLMPNTSVKWLPALIAGLVSAICLEINNNLSFLYISNVLRDKSLYGAIAILPVLMFGIYIFWVIIFMGAQLTYAIQNRSQNISLNSWESFSPAIKSILLFKSFFFIAKIFSEQKTPPNIAEISSFTQTPDEITNICLSKLESLKLVSTTKNNSSNEDLYIPARPLSNITLASFFEEIEWEKTIMKKEYDYFKENHKGENENSNFVEKYIEIFKTINKNPNLGISFSEFFEKKNS